MNARYMRFHAQRGAIGLTAAVTLGLLLVCLVLVVDSGRLYLEKRALQRVADMAALEAASTGGLCANPATPWTHDAAQMKALASAQRNGFSLSSTRSLTARIGGVVIGADSRRDLVENASLIDAVKVEVRKQVPASVIMGGWFGSQVNLSGQAVARRSNVASFSVGSGLLRLNSDESPLLSPLLKGLLNGNVDVSVLTPSGIAGANVELLKFLDLLKVKANAGTLDQLLETRIGLLPYVETVAQLLSASSDTAGVSLSGAKLVNIPAVTTTLGELLGIATGTPREALKANVNLFDMLLAGAVAANGKRSVALDLTVPGLASATLDITEAPRKALGPPGKNPVTGEWRTRATTGQLDLVLGLKPELLGILSLGGYGVNAKVDLALRVGLAQAEGALKSVRCTNPGQVQIEASTKTDNIRLTAVGSKTAPATITLDVLTLPILKAEIGLGGGQPPVIGSASRTLTYTSTSTPRPNGTVVTTFSPNPQMLSSQVALSLPSLQGTNIQLLYSECVPTLLNLFCILHGVLQLATNTVINTVLTVAGGAVNLLNSVLSALSSTVITPLLDALGIKLGFSEVMLLDVHTAPPQLVR